MPKPPRFGGKEKTSCKMSLGGFWPVIAGRSCVHILDSRGCRMSAVGGS